jgi:hypothetical protein
MNIDDIYKSNSKFLKAADLVVDGKSLKPVLEIETAEVQENTYNGETKKQIVDQTDMDGKTVDCIRVFPDLPEQPEERRQRFSGPEGGFNPARDQDDSSIPF